VHFDLFHPVLNVLEALSFVDGIGEHYAHGSPVVGLCDGFELLLTSCVPNLQSDTFFADSYGFDFEIDADGREVGGHEVVLAELEQHVGLAHTAVANHQQLNQVVVILVLLHML